MVVTRWRPILKNVGPSPRWRHQRSVLTGTFRMAATSDRVRKSSSAPSGIETVEMLETGMMVPSCVRRGACPRI